MSDTCVHRGVSLCILIHRPFSYIKHSRDTCLQYFAPLRLSLSSSSLLLLLFSVSSICCNAPATITSTVKADHSKPASHPVHTRHTRPHHPTSIDWGGSPHRTAIPRTVAPKQTAPTAVTALSLSLPPSASPPWRTSFEKSPRRPSTRAPPTRRSTNPAPTNSPRLSQDGCTRVGRSVLSPCPTMPVLRCSY
jgi:hypothetical protein